jgi:hypothetical protein
LDAKTSFGFQVLHNKIKCIYNKSKLIASIVKEGSNQINRGEKPLCMTMFLGLSNLLGCPSFFRMFKSVFQSWDSQICLPTYDEQAFAAKSLDNMIFF